MRRRAAKLWVTFGLLAAAAAWPGSAFAVDLPDVAGRPLTLDVTETSVVAQHFDARTAEGERTIDQGCGAWVNRGKGALRRGGWRLGLRRDSSLYWRRPEDRADLDP